MSVSVSVPGAVNLRDTGGLAAGGGARSRAGMLFRSGSLAHLDDDGRDALARLGLRAIVDLRDDEEVRSQPSALDARFPVPQRLPLFLGSTASFFVNDVSLEELYAHILDSSGDRIAGVARAVLAGSPVLVHCTAGKDRTGVSVAIVLAAAGVEREAVVADYARSEGLLPADRNARTIAWLRRAHPEAMHIEELVASSPAPVMAGVLSRVERDHGSAAGFLRDAGLDAPEVAELRRVLVEERGVRRG